MWQLAPQGYDRLLFLCALRQAREEEESAREKQPAMLIERDAKTLERSVAAAQERGRLVRISHIAG